jgi:hypothetical protein
VKPKEYRDKYNLLNTIDFNHTEFSEDFKRDFNAMKYQKASISQIDFLFKQVRQKFDNIFLGSSIEKNTLEGLWKLIFATILAPYRDQACPDYKEQKRKIAEEAKRREESWKRFQRFNNPFFSDDYEDFFRKRFENFFRSFLDNINLNTNMDQYLSIFSFNNINEVNESEIKSRFRKLAIQYHSDTGNVDGDDEFIRLTTAKDALLKYIGVGV